MSDKDINLKNPETQKRLALLGLAAQRREAEQPCPDDVRFAQLLEADSGSAEQQHFWDHLSWCESCREKWLVLSSELARSGDSKAKTGILRSRRGLLSLAGSACAVAVGVMLYLSIDYRPEHYEGTVLQAPADQDTTKISEAVRMDGLKKEAEAETAAEADAGQAVSEVKQYRRESQLQQPAEVKTSPAPQMAEAPMVQRRSQKVLADRQSFSVASGALESPIQFAEFIDSFLNFCDNPQEEISRAVFSEDMLEQGKKLLELDGTMTPEQKGLVEKIAQLLSGSEPVKDTELGTLCEESVRMAAERDHPPR